MRIVYRTDAGIQNPLPQQLSKSSATGFKRNAETVIIISAKKEKAEISNPNYTLQISDEALARNQEVRSHENAHMAALGTAAASPILYDTLTGPNGENIAVGGKIAVDLSEIPGDPEATLQKAHSIIAAAHAPGEPSAADLRTAERAYTLAQKAGEEIAKRYTGKSNIDLLV